MDQGAHYVKADLQVHTPRDPNWPLECVSDAGRRKFSSGFISACRKAGLGAVAITDHHDFGFVPWIREAALSELSGGGDPLPEDQQIVVFPGLELTLEVPCQALLIFSADFPGERLSAVLEKLGIDAADPSEAKAKQPSQLGFATLQDVYDRLDETDWLRDQYILLPNVTDGGHQTLMRKHMHGKYRDMPCVGGYLDGLAASVGTGNRSAFDGLDPNRGNKRIALIQTSDARSLDKLGSNATWIKWAAPTAEALRQACLAQESRIAHQEPAVPGISITRLQVSNSRFLGPIDVEFNSQCNALIGGRGTGKSTCLEYIRWGLCDERRQPKTGEEDPDVAQRIRLIEQTLEPVEGHVEVHFLLNGIPHFVRRHAVSGELLLKIGPNELQPASESEIQALLPIDAYSQRQLSGVGVDLAELQRFVTAPIRDRLKDLTARETDLVHAIRENFSSVQRHRTSTAAVRRDTLTFDSLAQQIKNMRESLNGLSDDDRETLAAKSGYDEADGLIASWTRRTEHAREQLETCKAALGELSSGMQPPRSDELPEEELLEELHATIATLLTDAERAVAEVAGRLSSGLDSGSELAILRARWTERHSAFVESYQAATARSSAHASKLEELGALEEQSNALRESVDVQHQELASLGDPLTKHVGLRKQWRELQSERTQLIKQQCDRLTELSAGLIRASISGEIGTESFTEEFKNVVRGSSLRASRIEAFMAAAVAAPNPLSTWHETLDELETWVLAQGDPAAKPPPPTTALKMLKTDELSKIAERVTPEAIFDLSLLGIDDHPVFEYRTKEGEYIAFADASAGQQATALLKVLLNQSGPPLIIDQPEDDLDNQVISEIVDLTWQAKAKRQLIFSSHNANLVVNGDAELVVCCDYRAAGDHSAGRIKLLGAIDIPAVRKEITVVMEGGEKAFRLRKEKYGF